MPPDDPSPTGRRRRGEIVMDPASWQAGYDAGLAGRSNKCPAEIPDGLAYISGYIEGKAVRLSRRQPTSHRQPSIAGPPAEKKNEVTNLDDSQLAEVLGMTSEDLKALRASQGEQLTRLRPDEHGRYAWDRWKERALAAGLEHALAQLGRAVMREAVNHDWPPHLVAECGWQDDGKAMLALAQKDPDAAAERWNHLLDTDGEHGRWDETGKWHPSR